MTAPGITVNTYAREGTKCFLFTTSVSSALPTPCSFPGLFGASESQTPDIYPHRLGANYFLLRSYEVKDILFTPNPRDLVLLLVESGQNLTLLSANTKRRRLRGAESTEGAT